MAKRSTEKSFCLLKEATLGFELVFIFILIQILTTRASASMEKSVAYRYQGPSLPAGAKEAGKDGSEDSTKFKDIPHFTQAIQNSSAPVGRDGVLDCHVENSDSFMIAWLRVDTQTILSMNEMIVSRNHRLSVVPSTDRRHWRLTIRDVRPSDQAWYMCQISTDPMLSQVGYLEITEPAQFLDNETSSDVVAREGHPARLVCRATGNPKPDIKWKREDKKAITNGKINGSVVEFERVSRTDNGAYLCIASNGVPPVVSRRISLNVLYAPQIHVHVQVAKAPIGERIHLNCTARGSPTPNVTWYRGIQKVKSDGSKHNVANDHREKSVFSSLEIIYVERSDDLIIYTCEGSNSEGTTKDTINIQVLEQISYDLPTDFLNGQSRTRTKEDVRQQSRARGDSVDQQRLQQQPRETKELGQHGYEYSTGRGRNQTRDDSLNSKWETTLVLNSGFQVTRKSTYLSIGTLFIIIVIS